MSTHLVNYVTLCDVVNTVDEALLASVCVPCRFVHSRKFHQPVKLSNLFGRWQQLATWKSSSSLSYWTVIVDSSWRVYRCLPAECWQVLRWFWRWRLRAAVAQAGECHRYHVLHGCTTRSRTPYASCCQGRPRPPAAYDYSPAGPRQLADSPAVHGTHTEANRASSTVLTTSQSVT